MIPQRTNPNPRSTAGRHELAARLQAMADLGAEPYPGHEGGPGVSGASGGGYTVR
jgi:hypothetical protein